MVKCQHQMINKNILPEKIQVNIEKDCEVTLNLNNLLLDRFILKESLGTIVGVVAVSLGDHRFKSLNHPLANNTR